MGGSSSKSSSSNQTTTNNVDRRFVAEGGGIGLTADNSTVNIQSVDKEVIAKALDTIDKADATQGQGFTQLLTLADKLFQGGAAVINEQQQSTMKQIEAINTTSNNVKGAIDQKTILILAAAGVAAIALSK